MNWDDTRLFLALVRSGSARAAAAERQLQGRVAQLSGEIRLTTANVIALYLIMDDLAEFTRLYPDIDMNAVISYDLFNPAKREADVAIRILRLESNPPEGLVGRKLATMKSCYYASECEPSEPSSLKR